MGGADTYDVVSTHSRPKAAGNERIGFYSWRERFQHTAARRRLEAQSVIGYIKNPVSTHSRPKAAGAA